MSLEEKSYAYIALESWLDPAYTDPAYTGPVYTETAIRKGETKCCDNISWGQSKVYLYSIDLLKHT